MPPRFAMLLLALFSCASADDDARIFPEGVKVSALPGGNGVLEMQALTLREGADGPELYAALRNVGDTPACSAALSAELYDADERSLAVGINGLLTQRFYRLTDGSHAIAACTGPGELTMTAITDLPADMHVEDVAYVVYRCPYFALDVTPIDGLQISDLRSAPSDAGERYTGVLLNALDVAVTNPSVTVFELDDAGRPFGTAIGRTTAELLPGATWSFETDVTHSVAADCVAFPAGAITNKDP